MNFVNTYLLLPLQRKIFKNFGHYDYQTSTFHLNEERVNEVFFDPAYNPFVDVLRETSHASAVASSKAAAQQQQQQHDFSTVRRRNTSDADGDLSTSSSPPNQTCHGPVDSEATAATAAEEAEKKRESTAGVPRSPLVRLLRGKIRSAGLVPFLRQVTTQKSLSVESVDLVFDVANTALPDSTGDSHTEIPSPVTCPASVSHDAENGIACQRGGAHFPDTGAAGLSAAQVGDDGKPTVLPLSSSRRLQRDEMAKMARSYSIEDQSWLHEENEGSSPDATEANSGDLDTDVGLLTADDAAKPGSPKGSPTTQFHTVGDLMTYLKQQLQGVTIGVEEVRLTFCFPPVGATGSLLRNTDSASRLSGRPHAATRASPEAVPLRVCSGTRVLHLSCRRGLRLTVDESTGASVEDMQCTASIQDWQCYIHLVASDGPLPSEFSLDDLVFTTSTALTASSVVHLPGATSNADNKAGAGDPFTVRIARRGGGIDANVVSTSPSPSPVSADVPPPTKVLVDVDAAEGWSIVLSAVQIAHLVGMMRQLMGGTTVSDESAGSVCSHSSFSSTVVPAGTSAELDKQVTAPQLDVDETVTGTTLFAKQLRPAAKYVSVHCGGCSISLLTKPVVDTNAVACAWRCALSSQHLAFLDPRATDPLQKPTSASAVPVYEAFTTPHFTYVMRDVDILFPNIDAEAPLSSSTPCPAAGGVFQQSARKRKIYRRIFDNKLADPAVTEKLLRARAGAASSNNGGVASFFFGAGSISVLEYRHASPTAGQRNAASSHLSTTTEVSGAPLLSPLQSHSMRPAKLMHAERMPYALVIFHRSTPPLPEQTPAAGVLAPPSPCLRIYQETIVVGVAKISVQLDAELVEVLAMYGTTIAELIRQVGSVHHRCGAKRNCTAEARIGATGLSARTHSSPPSPTLLRSPVIRTCSSVKVLLESVEASVRFPVHPTGTATAPEFPHHPTDGMSASTASPASVAAEPQSLLLGRLLQRLRESSFDTHRHNRALLRRRVRQAKNEGNHVAASPTMVSAMLAEEAAVAAAIAVQEQLGFPEDVDTGARFLPEFLSFSLRDLQVVHTPSATTAGRGAYAATPAGVVYTPACTSVKWREAVVYLQDILEQTKSELFRVDYSREMNINVTHTSLPSLNGGTWRALERVLALQICLGEITTTALTQDDYLLASYYVNELLMVLSQCRQRLHAGRVATATGEPGSSGPPGDQVPAVGVACVCPDGFPAPVEAGASSMDASDKSRSLGMSGGAVRPSECREQLIEHRARSVAEAFAMADAQTTCRGCVGERVSRCAVGDGIADGSSMPKFQGSGDEGDSADSLRNVVPELWRLLDTTCTSLDVRVSRIRLGLFAPRLSPMGQVVGDPLYRCLPRAQRRCLIDLNCLYHLYIMELVDVSVRGLSGDGSLAKAGQANYARVLLGGFSLWERQPAPAPAPAPPFTSCDGRDTVGGAGTAAASPLYKGYISNSVGSGGAPPVSHGLGGGAYRDLAYYMPNSQAAHSGHRHPGTLVQLVQSYTKVRGDEEEVDDWCYKDVGGTTEGDVDIGGQCFSHSSQVLSDVWGAYVRELQTIATTTGQAAHAPLPTARESGVCEVRVLEMVRDRPMANAAQSCHTTSFVPTAFSASPVPPNRRYLWLQLTGLGLHHAVAYNGDHLAAVLKQYFSGGDGTAAPAASAVRDGGEARGGAEGLAMFAFTEETLWKTKVHVNIVNLMATYRPLGAGRSLAVLLLPRASVLIKLPVIATETPTSAEAHDTAIPPEDPRRGGAAARSTATPLLLPAPEDVSAPLTMRAQAWLHTSLPLYVCNDCDVETLVREVLNPAESDEWDVDLESAGFVRLCEVISTAACSSCTSETQQSTVAAGAPTTGNPPLCSRTPNLILTVRSKRFSASASGDHGSGDRREEAGSIDYAYLAPTVSMHLQHIELSAFMAKDSFEVFRELLEAWGSGADLKVTDAPAALVMRSGPGFEWVAEEVARSCAPMTFRVNPYLATRDRAVEEDASTGGFQPSPLGAPKMRTIASVDSTSHYPFLLSTTSLPASSDFESLWTVPEKSKRGPPTGVGGYNASYSAFRRSASAYGYTHWLDALHASHGRDLALYDTYQTRTAQLLDGEPWVSPHQQVHSTLLTASGVEQEGTRRGRSASPLLASPADGVQQSRRYDEVSDTISVSSADDDDLTAEEGAAAVTLTRDIDCVHGGAPFLLPQPPRPRESASGNEMSLSSSFSDLEDTVASGAQLQWCVLPSEDLAASLQLASRNAWHLGDCTDLNAVAGDSHIASERRIDLFGACNRQPHFLSCWSRERVEAARQRRAVRLNRLDCTDDSLLHDIPEKYLYPPVELEFFLSDCSLNISLYEGTDLMPAAVRKQRRGYLQIVSRGANLAQAAPYTFGSDRRSEAALRAMSSNSASADTGAPSVTACTAALAHDSSHISSDRTKLSISHCSYCTARDIDAAWPLRAISGESSTSRLERLHQRGCRSGFGDRDGSKRLVLSCRGITVQMDTFPQGSEEDLWFHVVVGETTVFDCINTSDVHRLLTATPKPSAPLVGQPRRGSGVVRGHADMPGVKTGGGCSRSGETDARHLELTGLLTSSKSVLAATSGGMREASRAFFTVSHFQQGGSELSLVVRLQPTSLTWSGASVDFAQSFFSTVSASPPSSPGNNKGAAMIAATSLSVPAAEAGTISGTEAPPLFYRRVVILPTTLTAAGSFQSDKGVLAALSEGNSLDALRSVPVLSWISLQEIPLPIPFMRVEDCSSAATLLQRIVEDSNCVSIRFLLTACCCGLQPLSAVTRVGEAAKGLLLLPLSNYRGAALQHAIRTASSVFMQELLTQTSDMAALLTSGCYHASRSLLEVLVAPQYRELTIEEPSRASQPAGVADGWRQGQEQLRVGLQEALTIASYCTGPDGGLLRVPAAALRLLMGVSGAATTTLWGVRNSQGSAMRERDGHIYKKKC
ncbi:hypothetical protein, conserved [Leishmania tarentolae]|uniref:Autophagy-related protein 2 n=1 Tax=Leishmania tarentolae TaxID=5689 RepID=A0A640KSL2_LEITA|nr:hypothetical protein, conserved [Leishmania tarentolae]